MAEAVVPAPTTAPARPRPSLRGWLTRNPVVLKELRGRMRGPRAFVVLTTYLLLMSGFVTLLYVVYIASTNNVYSNPGSQLIGKFVFGAVVGIELLLVCFIAPAFTAGSISGEREHQTYDLLRTTLLTASQLVLGKLASALSYILLLLVAAVPLQSLAFLLGGVALEEVLIATVLLVATAFLFGTSGIFFSSFMRWPPPCSPMPLR
jgi:ABC-2 type transport system permease protein